MVNPNHDTIECAALILILLSLSTAKCFRHNRKEFPPEFWGNSIEWNRDIYVLVLSERWRRNSFGSITTILF